MVPIGFLKKWLISNGQKIEKILKHLGIKKLIILFLRKKKCLRKKMFKNK